LKATFNKGLFYPVHSDSTLIKCCDLNWGACKMFTRSLIGYWVFLGCFLISWKTTKKSQLPKSWAEVEYRYMSMTTLDVEWIYHLFQDLCFQLSVIIILHCDNKATWRVAKISSLCWSKSKLQAHNVNMKYDLANTSCPMKTTLFKFCHFGWLLTISRLENNA